MFDRDRQQAELLTQFLEARAGNPLLLPPRNLDTDLVTVTAPLERHLIPPRPSAHFVRLLDGQLSAAAAVSTDSHNGIIKSPADSELTVAQTDAGWRVVDTPSRSHLSELVHLAAAVLAITLVGSVLIFLFSEHEDALAPGTGTLPGESERLYIVARNGVTVLDPSAGTELYSIDASNPYAALSPDRSRLYVVGAGGTDQLVAFDAATGDEIWRTTVRHRLYYMGGSVPSILGVSPDGSQIYVHSYDNVGDFGDYGQDATNIPTWAHVIDARTGEHLFDTEKVPGYCHAEVFASAVSKVIYEICMNTGLIRVSDRESGEMLGTVNAGARIIAALPSPDQSDVYLIGNMIRVYDTDTWQIISSTSLDDLPVAQYPFGLAALSPDGNLLYIGLRSDNSSDAQQIREIAVLDTSSWAEVGRIAIDINLKPGVLSVSADGQNLYVAEQQATETAGKVVKVDIASGEASTILALNSEVLRVLSFSPPVEDQQSDVHVDLTPTVEPSPTVAVDGPDEGIPSAWLAFNNERQQGELADACDWPGYSMERGCSDLAGLYYPRDIMDVPQDTVMIFSIEGMVGLDLVNVRASAFSIDETAVEELGGKPFMEFPGVPGFTLPVNWSPTEMTITADLPPGEYVVGVDVSLPFEGDPPVDGIATTTTGSATYTFHVRDVGDPSLTPTPDVPSAWMTHDGNSQRGEFAYGCNWPGYPICVDPGGLLYPAEILNLPEGAELTFVPVDLNDIDVTHVTGVAYNLADAVIGDLNGVPYLRYPPPVEESLLITHLGETIIVADLPIGKYALAMTLHSSDGWATYGFHISVDEIHEPSREPHTIGTITEVRQRGEDLSILIVEHPENPNAGDQTYITVRPNSRVFEHTVEGVVRRTAADLQVGRRVTVAITGAIASSYPGYAYGSEVVIVRTETDGPPDPDDLVTMTFQHSQITGFSAIPRGDRLYVTYSIIDGASGEAVLCANDEPGAETCASGYGFQAEVEVPRGAELNFTINRLSQDNPDEPEIVKQGREVVDADMITRSWYRYGASNPGGY